MRYLSKDKTYPNRSSMSKNFYNYMNECMFVDGTALLATTQSGIEQVTIAYMAGGSNEEFQYAMVYLCDNGIRFMKGFCPSGLYI